MPVVVVQGFVSVVNSRACRATLNSLCFLFVMGVIMLIEAMISVLIEREFD